MSISLACTSVTLLFLIDKVIPVLQIKLRSHQIDAEMKAQPFPFYFTPCGAAAVRSR